MMATNMKSMFEELLAEHKDLQEKSSAKEIKFMENAKNLNLSIKKKMKEVDEFKKNIF